MNKSLQQSLFVWKFFVRAHPDSDLEGVVELIVEETQKETLKNVGERLKRQLQGESCAFIYENNDLGLKALIENYLLRGEMPDETNK